jgi:signal transduction histidine kinase
MKNLYRILIEPRSSELDIRNRERVLNYVLVGLLTLVAAEFMNSVLGFAVSGQHLSFYRMLSFFVVLAIFTTLYWLAHWRGYIKIAGLSVVILLLIITAAVILGWGILTPTGVLLFGLIIVMAGILLGARYALYTALLSIGLLSLFEYLKVRHVVTPNLAWMQRPSSFSDIMGFAVIYVIIALVSWLYNQQMERSLKRVQQSEAALERQNERLEATVKERTAELESAQLERLQQVYRLAELGRISSALFHDLANHLTAVSLDIEGLGNSQKSELMLRVQADIGYIDDVVQRVRLQLRGQGSVERFNVASEINKVLKILNYKMVQSKITFHFQKPKKTIYLETDVIPFRQIISNLISNAIDASNHKNAPTRKIAVQLSEVDGAIIIAVTDWGIGIKAAQQSKIFEPFYSSKTDGTGIGLFIVKQIVENDLHGRITVSSSPKTGTIFTVSLPSHGVR